jgi:hypothetical protein
MTRLTLLLLLIAAPLTFAQKKDKNGFIPLFNGKDMTNWKVSGDQSTFTVKDGAMVAKGPVAHAFYDGPVENHDFKNFEFMVDVMTLPGSNGGIYFHTAFKEDERFPKKGFEVQVNTTHRDPIKSGSLYHVKDIGADDITMTKDNEWFTEHIIVQGDTVTVRLNGKEVVKWTQPADWNGGREGAGRVLGSGTFAFQGHDPNSTVYYKNPRVKVLK